MDPRAKALAHYFRENAHATGQCVCGSKVQAVCFTANIKGFVIQHREDCPVVLAQVLNPEPKP